jgi:hypothetical protein
MENISPPGVDRDADRSNENPWKSVLDHGSNARRVLTSVGGRRVAHSTKIALTKNGGLMGVMFELEQVLGGILKKECMVLDARAGKPDSRLLKKPQPLGFCPVRQCLPILFREKHQAEMTRVNSCLLTRRTVHDMGDQLVIGQSERHGLGGFASEFAPESLDIELLGLIDVVDWESQVKQDVLHVQRPLTVGRAEPSHHPAAMCGVTWAIVNRPSGATTNVPAAPAIRETSSRKTILAAVDGDFPAASRSQIALATARRMMPSP